MLGDNMYLHCLFTCTELPPNRYSAKEDLMGYSKIPWEFLLLLWKSPISGRNSIIILFVFVFILSCFSPFGTVKCDFVP